MDDRYLISEFNEAGALREIEEALERPLRLYVSRQRFWHKKGNVFGDHERRCENILDITAGGSQIECAKQIQDVIIEDLRSQRECFSDSKKKRSLYSVCYYISPVNAEYIVCADVQINPDARGVWPEDISVRLAVEHALFEETVEPDIDLSEISVEDVDLGNGFLPCLWKMWGMKDVPPSQNPYLESTLPFDGRRIG